MNGLPSTTSGEPALTAAESLALIENQTKAVHRRLGGNPVVFLAPWGLAYLIGFGLLSLTYPSTDVSGPVSTGLLIIAAVISTIAGARTGRGVHGPGRTASAMYGWSWIIGFAALFAINAGIEREGLSDDAQTLLWSGSSLLLVGVLYLTGGAMGQDRFLYGLGVWMLLTGAASVLAGVPGNYAVLAVAGGGGLLAAAGYVMVALRRPVAG